MTVKVWLEATSKKLAKAKINTAQLDSLVLLEDETGHDRSWLLAHPEYQISVSHLLKLNKKIIRRQKHEPLAYIRGFTEFYGRRFKVNQDVLEPRPESETMIDLLKQIVASDQPVVTSLQLLDVGTGSGALAITAKLELPSLSVIATDIDPKCLKIAHQNAKTLKADINFLQGDLLTPLEPGAIGCELWAIMANLPYVPNDWQVNASASQEPKLAIFGGVDGLEVYRRLFSQLNHLKMTPKYVLTESMPSQHQELATIAELNGFEILKTNDFIQVWCRA